MRLWRKILYFSFRVLSISLAIFFTQSLCFLLQNQHQKKLKSFFLAAGRSGGHIIPAKTLAKNQILKTPDIKIIFFSTNSQLDTHLLKHDASIQQHIPLTLENIPRNNVFSLFFYTLEIAKIARFACAYFRNHRPAKCISTGGYITLPIGLAAWLSNTPFFLYELNVIPGKAVKIMGALATTIFCSFKKTICTFPFFYNATNAPYPIRFTPNDIVSKEQARSYLGIDQKLFTIAILGGSQGSHLFNTLIPSVLTKQNKHFPLQIIHQTGSQEEQYVNSYYAEAKIPALVFSFRNDIAAIYSAADICISRAGAGSIFELLFFEKPSIIIPLATKTTDHQKDNAKAISEEFPNLYTYLEQDALEHNQELLIQQILRLSTFSAPSSGHKKE